LRKGCGLLVTRVNAYAACYGWYFAMAGRMVSDFWPIFQAADIATKKTKCSLGL